MRERTLYIGNCTLLRMFKHAPQYRSRSHINSSARQVESTSSLQVFSIDIRMTIESVEFHARLSVRLVSFSQFEDIVQVNRADSPESQHG